MRNETRPAVGEERREKERKKRPSTIYCCCCCCCCCTGAATAMRCCGPPPQMLIEPAAVRRQAASRGRAASKPSRRRFNLVASHSLAYIRPPLHLCPTVRQRREQLIESRIFVFFPFSYFPAKYSQLYSVLLREHCAAWFQCRSGEKVEPLRISQFA